MADGFVVAARPRGRLGADGAGLLDDLDQGAAVGTLATRVHNTLAEMIVGVAVARGESRVLLTGGCFQNRYLTERTVARLQAVGRRPYWHQRVPPNDGGISAGQVAAWLRADAAAPAPVEPWPEPVAVPARRPVSQQGACTMCLAVPGRILSIENTDPVLRAGRVDFAGIVKRVNLSCVPEAVVGDYVLVHVGFAISTVDEAEARQVFSYLREMGELDRARERARVMKFVDEYRDARAAGRYARALGRITTRPWTLMEVCGGQTHAIVKFGVDELLPPQVTLVHGPGCPVCVTPLEIIEKAIEIAARPGVIFCSFGDMLRVPGRDTDLLSVKARGGDVRIVYSPLDAVEIARAQSRRARWCSSPSASRPRRRPTPWRCTRRRGPASRTSRCWCRTCWCRRPWRPSSRRRTAACRASWPPATCARSWATRSTSRSWRATRCRSWSPASSRSTSCRACTCA